jgi:hypothetical protein
VAAAAVVGIRELSEDYGNSTDMDPFIIDAFTSDLHWSEGTPAIP